MNNVVMFYTKYYGERSLPIGLLVLKLFISVKPGEILNEKRSVLF